MQQRKTLSEDIDRLSENVYRNFRTTIQDRDSFNLAFNEYLTKEEMGEGLSHAQDTELRNKVWNRLSGKHDIVGTPQPTRKEFKTTITQKTKAVKPTKARPQYKFVRLGRAKGKTLYARPTRVKIRNKYYKRFVDRRGRFVSVKPPKKE